ncbi:MAG: DUF3060 domain-containing protein [Geminicoccaceae bacterium]
MQHRRATVVLVLVATGLLASCSRKAPSEAPLTVAGVTEYSQSRVQGDIACGHDPVVLKGDRTVLNLTGACTNVTIAGDHNDITVELAPGAQVTASGSHNDITWRLSQPGAEPVLSSTGTSNSFHAP